MTVPAGKHFPVFIGGVEPFILIAVPLFVFTGELLAQGGVGKRIVEFARVLFGWLPGGLGVVTVISRACCSAVSRGRRLPTPQPSARWSSRPCWRAAIRAVSPRRWWRWPARWRLLMPLSIPFLVYAFVSACRCARLSMAGLVPALLSGLALIAVCMWHGKSHRLSTTGGKRAIAGADLEARRLWQAGPALLMPVFIIGGIWSGYFTPDRSRLRWPWCTAWWSRCFYTSDLKLSATFRSCCSRLS